MKKRIITIVLGLLLMGTAGVQTYLGQCVLTNTDCAFEVEMRTCGKSWCAECWTPMRCCETQTGPCWPEDPLHYGYFRFCNSSCDQGAGDPEW